MIDITVWQDAVGNIAKFTVSGHAGYADAGKDIVCAGVSSLVITTINGLEHIAKVPISYEIDETGHISCELAEGLSEDIMLKAQLLCDTMLLGLKLTSENYPGFIRIRSTKRPRG